MLKNDIITAEHVANGTDIQGIPWESLPFSREEYRATRIREGSRRDSPEFIKSSNNTVDENNVTLHNIQLRTFFNFHYNTRLVKPSVLHFQLRNLVWATSRKDAFISHYGMIQHWDAAAKRKNDFLDLTGPEASGSAELGLVQVSTMFAKDDLVVAGGYNGEVIVKRIGTDTVMHNLKITNDENAITNAIDMFDRKLMISSNDCCVRCFDVETFTEDSLFRFNNPVNHATRQPNGKMIVVAGDDKPVQILDGDSGERITQLHGHKHFSFATGWHPSGQMFATGSEDGTCRVWDVRNMSQAQTVLSARMGVVRSLRFPACGRFLVMAESRDFVHIFDIDGGSFSACQEIEIFGEIVGIALAPSAESLFIGVGDRMYASVIAYERKDRNTVADF